MTLVHRQPPGYQWKAPDSARFLLVPAPGGLTMTQGPRNESEGTNYHEPVLAEEVAEIFQPLTSGVVVDATFGGGGHTRRLLEAMREGTQIVGIDRDPEAVANAGLLDDDRVRVLRGNFADLESLLEEAHVNEPVGVLFDLGVSSHQFDEGSRGFSYRFDGPLDMRMGPDAELTADDVVNGWDESRLAAAIRRFGEEPLAGRIAGAIVANRPIRSTGHLAEVIAEATPAAVRRKGHPARKTFQAIRLAVNEELDALKRGLDLNKKETAKAAEKAEKLAREAAEKASKAAKDARAAAAAPVTAAKASVPKTKKKKGPRTYKPTPINVNKNVVKVTPG